LNEDVSAMQAIRHPITRRSLGALAGAALARPALAQDPWPSRPISLVVTYAPGGSADVLARLIAPGMGKALGTTVVVENRAGGGGIVGSDYVARAAPDGHVLQIGAVSSHAIAKQLFGARLPYDPQRSFTPVSMILSQPNVLLIGNHVPVRNVEEFLRWGKTQRAVLFGTAGVGSSNHLSGAMIGDAFGIRMEHVPYRSGGQALSDLMAGNVHGVVDNIVTAAPLAKDGRARAIGVTSAGRSDLLPEIPSFREAGAPDFDLVSWQALYGPAGIPAARTARLNAALREALADPTVRTRLTESGAAISPGSPEELAQFMEAEIPKWSRLVTISGATPD
jgi:tripartite-type tricarboxylate transporter receptor subunit TctC